MNLVHAAVVRSIRRVAVETSNNNADFTNPMTAGIFVNIIAWASYQRDKDITPYLRTLKSDGELNVKYPEATELQKKLLE